MVNLICYSIYFLNEFKSMENFKKSMISLLRDCANLYHCNFSTHATEANMRLKHFKIFLFSRSVI